MTLHMNEWQRAELRGSIVALVCTEGPLSGKEIAGRLAEQIYNPRAEEA